MHFNATLFGWLLLLNYAAVAQQYTVSTIAGGGTFPTPADALDAALPFAGGLAFDSSGNLYSTAGNCVYKIDGNGMVTRIVGDSRGTYSGDGGPAINAELNSPVGLAFDGAGNLYIGDTHNFRLRIVTPDGVITTLAGNGTSGGAGEGGPALNASIYPLGIGIDSSGDIFLTNGLRVQMISPGGIITTIAGGGTGGDGGPAADAQVSFAYPLALDGNGNVYFGDGNRIRQIAADGTISTVAGGTASGFSGDGGPAINALLSGPTGLAFDSYDNLYIADYGNNRIRMVTPDGSITTVAGNGTRGGSGDQGPATQARLSSPIGIAVDGSGNLYIGDSGNDRIRMVSPGGIIQTVTGNGTVWYGGDGGPGTAAALDFPPSVAVDCFGNVYIPDEFNNRVRVVSPAGIISNFAGTGVQGFSGDGGLAVNARLNFPRSVASDALGNVYIADAGNERVRMVSPDGTISTVAGSGSGVDSGDGGPAIRAGINSPYGIAIDLSGDLYIAEMNGNRVRMISGGLITTVAGDGTKGDTGDGGPAVMARLYNPWGIAVDTAGNIYVAESSYRVRQISANGVISTLAGNGTSGYSGDGGPAAQAQLSSAYGVAADIAGNIYIPDGSNYRIRRVGPDGIITTLAGNGTPGYSGDGGDALQAQFELTQGIAVDASGNIYIADTGNGAIRVLTPSAQ